jgi:hypothetical protein
MDATTIPCRKIFSHLYRLPITQKQPLFRRAPPPRAADPPPLPPAPAYPRITAGGSHRTDV